jgi:hypothetical protein
MSYTRMEYCKHALGIDVNVGVHSVSWVTLRESLHRGTVRLDLQLWKICIKQEGS